MDLRINLIIKKDRKTVNPLAFAPIIGITKVSADSDKLLEFLESFANWLEFFSDFSSQYQEIKQKIGIDFVPPEPPPRPERIPGEGPPNLKSN